MSSLGWVDFSSEDRTRVQEVMALLKQPGTLDELGIGQVRDAFSDLLFPGFSTIQTTARYFLAVPKILLDWAQLSPSKRRSQPLAAFLERAENDLAKRLRDNHTWLGLSLENIIGHTVVEIGGVARRPSSTYWNGLRVFSIVSSSRSLAEFCRDWKQGADDYALVDSEEGNDDADHRFDAEVRRPPDSKGDWPTNLTLALTRNESNFLSERFRTAKGVQHSVAAQLLSAGLADRALAEEHEDFAAFSIWARQQSALSQVCRKNIEGAQRFSEAIEGAHIIFNRILAEMLEDEVLQSRCEQLYKDWKDRVAQGGIFHSKASQEWLEVPIAVQISVSHRTTSFLHEWNEAMCRNAPLQTLEALVQGQAVKNKPGRSLLVQLPQKTSSWYGMRALGYRWGTARRMLRDVMEGQKCSA